MFTTTRFIWICWVLLILICNAPEHFYSDHATYIAGKAASGIGSMIMLALAFSIKPTKQTNYIIGVDTAEKK